MKTIYLHGSLGKRFGKQYTINVADLVSAYSFLSKQIPGFRNAIKVGKFRVIRGETYENGRPKPGSIYLSLDEARMPIRDELHIYPVIEGAAANKKSIGKIIVGVLLVGLAIALPGSFALIAAGNLTMAGSIALAGVAIALGGVAMMLAPSPKASKGKEDENASFLFDGAVNTYGQGGCVPLAYGRVFCGSKIISASLDIIDMSVPYVDAGDIQTNGSGSFIGSLVPTGGFISPDGYFVSGSDIDYDGDGIVDFSQEVQTTVDQS